MPAGTDDLTPYAVPIVGQPFTVREWWPIALLNCNCDEKHPLLVQGFNRPSRCPSCQRGAVALGMAIDPQGGQVVLQLGSVPAPRGHDA